MQTLAVGGRTVTVSSFAGLDDDALAVVALGVERAVERYARCRAVDEMPVRARHVRIAVRGHLRAGLGRYDTAHDVIELDAGTLAAGDHETLEHELADHRLPYLAGDSRWASYGHRRRSICA